MKYTINLFWDSKTNVWIATSNDVQGLALEAGSIDILIERVKLAVPELLFLNRGLVQQPISLYFCLEVEIGTS